MPRSQVRPPLGGYFWFRRVNADLCHRVEGSGVDLVVFEGMGRAIHTNYTARLRVDTLKAAVIKTQWLADRLGGPIFSVIFKFEEVDE